MGRKTLIAIFVVLIMVLFALNLFEGSISIPASDVFGILLGDESAKPSWRYIILESRLPQAITAILCGASLAASGLLLQDLIKILHPDIPHLPEPRYYHKIE